MHNRSLIVSCKITDLVLYFQRCIVMRQFHFSHDQVKHDYSLPRAYAVICGRFNITVNRDYLHAQNQGKLDNVCLQQFSSIFKSTIFVIITMQIPTQRVNPHNSLLIIPSTSGLDMFYTRSGTPYNTYGVN